MTIEKGNSVDMVHESTFSRRETFLLFAGALAAGAVAAACGSSGVSISNGPGEGLVGFKNDPSGTSATLTGTLLGSPVSGTAQIADGYPNQVDGNVGGSEFHLSLAPTGSGLSVNGTFAGDSVSGVVSGDSSGVQFSGEIGSHHVSGSAESDYGALQGYEAYKPTFKIS